MGIIINNKKHLFTRLPIGLIIIASGAFSPLILGLAGSWITELITGKVCHEGNCFWMALPWLSMITIPISGLLLILFILVIIIDFISIIRTKRNSQCNKN